DWKEALAQTIADAASHHCAGAEASDNRQIVAIGEVGMDLHYGRDFEREQEEVFRAQLDLALELHLPVIVHSRDAIEQTFRILEDYRGRGLTGVFHAFSGSLETFERLDGYGDWMVGIGGVLTFKNASIARTAADIPLERIILETDSPYLTPTPHRGERNESSYIPLIAEFLAGVKNTDIGEIAETTTRNAVKLFNI
ncbi:MAG: TatD family hydrolase, partial [Bacteroidales bacterium]|nr:TatD family hydrolase [Bacteroidales bacterium]